MPSGGAYVIRLNVDPWVRPFVACMTRMGFAGGAGNKFRQSVVDFVCANGLRQP